MTPSLKPAPASTPRHAEDLPPATQPTLVWHPQCPPRNVDQYRQLAHAIRRAGLVQQQRILAVTSAYPGEGKTLSTVNIAASLASSYRQRVLIVDADLRRPSLTALLDPEATGDGLAEWLGQGGDRACPMRRVSEGLSIVPAGTAQDDPIALLSSPRLRVLLESARADFDLVLVDTPPVGLLCDASVLVDSLDAYVMVVAAGRTSFTMVRQAIAKLGRDRVVGLVLNRTRGGTGPEGEKYYAGYYYRSGNGRAKDRSS